MIKIENHCVQCGLPCLGKKCPKREVKVAYCDLCEIVEADFSVEDTDYCESCIEFFLSECFNGLTIRDKAKALNIKLKQID